MNSLAVRLITADDLCRALEATLVAGIPVLVEHLNALDPDLGLEDISEWLQLPTIEALTAANYPVGAVSSPGLVARPTRRGFDTYDATWRLVAGVYDRGIDHDDTARRARTWAAVLRGVVLVDPTLGGIADSTMWAGEELDRVNLRNQARTLGAGVIAVDVHVKDVVNTLGLLSPPGPPVTSTHTTVTRSEE